MTRADFQEITTVALIRYRGNEISGVRSDENNADVGGHPDSLHRMGMARDAFFHSFGEMIACATYALRQGVWVKRNGHLTLHFQALVPQGLSLEDQMQKVDTWATELAST